MKLLSNDEYKKIELLLMDSKNVVANDNKLKTAIEEIKSFFTIPIYSEFLDIFYINRKNYKNRYCSNRSLFRYLSRKLYIQESTLYAIRKEIIYKSAMIFYKYDII